MTADLLDRAVAAMRAAPPCSSCAEVLRHPSFALREAHRGRCDCARLVLLAALRVVLAEPSEAAINVVRRIPRNVPRKLLRAAFAATLAELEDGR